MTMWELFIIAVGLSMDAFAVSICKGITLKKWDIKKALLAGLYFGAFQGIMPLIGYVLGVKFQSLVVSIDHWIAFILLGAIGISMIRDTKEDKDEIGDSFSMKEMFPLALATSIDALAIGITFAFLQVQIIPAVSLIGIITFIISFMGIFIGHTFGVRYRSMAEICGGIVLICMGVKILVEHTGIL